MKKHRDQRKGGFPSLPEDHDLTEDELEMRAFLERSWGTAEMAARVLGVNLPSLDCGCGEDDGNSR